MKWSEVKVTQSCPTLCDPMNYTVHEILQARILEWVAFPFSWGSSQPRDRTRVPHIAVGFFTSWAMREALKYKKGVGKRKSKSRDNCEIELMGKDGKLDLTRREPWLPGFCLLGLYYICCMSSVFWGKMNWNSSHVTGRKTAPRLKVLTLLLTQSNTTIYLCK